MYNFKKNHKIIIGIIIIIISAFVCYYVYAKEENTQETIDIDNNIETEKPKEAETKRILVHISGAVNQEGIIEMEEGSRIADAVDKARRTKRKCVS